MAKAKPRHLHEVKAFAAYDVRGNLLYATIKPTKDEAEEALERFNPRVDGYPYTFRVLPVFIGCDLNFQHQLDFEG